MSIIESAISWMERTAKDDSHGYDQKYRWGERGDYDCSSAVITAWQQAGIPVKTKGATYTGNMYTVFLSCGFKDVTNEITLSNGNGLRRGDVLLNRTHHTAMYCGNGLEVEASINEHGRAVGGVPGDQTGKEFFIRKYRNYPWNYVLRYPVTRFVYWDSKKGNGVKLVVTATDLNMRNGSEANPLSTIVKTLYKGETVMWYGYYLYDNDWTKWYLVTDGAAKGYMCTGEGTRHYLEATT